MDHLLFLMDGNGLDYNNQHGESKRAYGNLLYNLTFGKIELYYIMHELVVFMQFLSEKIFCLFILNHLTRKNNLNSFSLVVRVLHTYQRGIITPSYSNICI